MAKEKPENGTGDPRLDAMLARVAAKVAENEAQRAAEAEMEAQRAPESASEASPRGTGRVESAENGTEPPEEVRPVKRPDPILPRIVVKEHPSREAAQLAFGGLVEGRDDLPGLAQQLPLFREPEGPRVPILELADLRRGPIMAQGRGAPLDLRILVAACVMLPFDSPPPSNGRTLTPTVRELRDFCFPNGWQRGRDWPRLIAALKRMSNHAVPGPFHWPGRGIVRDWILVALRGGATLDAQLDDVVLLHVLMPPGSPARAADRRPGAVPAWGTLGPALPSVHRGLPTGVAAGSEPPTPSPESPLPHVELESRQLPRLDAGGAAAAGVRGRGQARPDPRQSGRRVGSVAGLQDPDPEGFDFRRAARLADRAGRGGRGAPERGCRPSCWRATERRNLVSCCFLAMHLPFNEAGTPARQMFHCWTSP